MNNRTYLSPPHMGGGELAYISTAFETNWVSPAGPNIDAFERSLEAYSAVSFCAALSSGTAAIHLALIILGVEQGDEVICSSFTFAGTCNPIAYLKAIPVFVDSEQESWNMDPELLEDAIKDRMRNGKKPKAIIPVHLYGMPAKIDEILSIAHRYEIPVIEDAAEGLGSTYQGKQLGSFGDIGIFSFNGNKIITTSGGGAMVSENQAWIAKAKFLATQARDPAPHYQHSHIGYNYRLSNICAGIGLGQMEVLNDRVMQRRRNFEFYRAALGGIEGLSFQPESKKSLSNRWLSCITIEHPIKRTPLDILQALEKENIESRPLWKPMHVQPVFRNAPHYGGKVSEDLFARGVCLPSGSNMTEKGLNRVVKAIQKTICS